MELILIFVLGASLGSFCNVCIYRLPRGLNVITGRSFCPCCKRRLRWFELIPLASYVMLRGRCLRCQGRISLQYPAVELISGSLIVLTFIEYGLSVASVTCVVFLLDLLVIAFTDWQTLIIPNEVLLTALLVGIACEIFALPVYPSMHISSLSFSLSPGTGLVSGVFSSVIMSLLLIGGNLIFRKETMGFGDVKLAGVIGFYVGWKIFLAVLWIAAVAGGLYGLIILYVTKKPKDTKLPFGSFLAVAAGAASVFQSEVESVLNNWLPEMP